MKNGRPIGSRGGGRAPAMVILPTKGDGAARSGFLGYDSHYWERPLWDIR